MSSEKSSEHETPEFHLPESPSTGRSSIPGDQNVVVIGANGSGKSRLGAWIELESPQKERAHRISAQKSLAMPDSVQPKSLEEAKTELLLGRGNLELESLNPQRLAREKRRQRWSKSPTTQSLRDFNQLMVYLFSEEFEKSTRYRRNEKNVDQHTDPPTTKLDTIQRIWEEVLPHRKLDVGGGELNTYSPDRPEASYNAAEMSDGERVAFYLIGECLAAPEDGIIIVDEPEIHLHRSIQSDLWDAIEHERDDCQFVYLTHDLNFASGREATRLWLRDYDGEDWDWKTVPYPQPGIPEEVLLSILGSRKPILFVEGDHGSLDYHIYTHIYPDYTVVPCGGSGEVKSATRSFEGLNELHELDCQGLIDRDYREEETIKALEKRSIYVTQVSEVENLLLTEDVMRAFAMEKAFDDAGKRIEDAKETVFDQLDEEQNRVAASIAGQRIRHRLKSFGPDHDNKSELTKAFKEATDLDLDQTHQEAKQKVDSILKDRDYDAAIRIFDQKGLIHRIAPSFNTEGEEYKDYATRLVGSGHEGLISAIQNSVPTL